MSNGDALVIIFCYLYPYHRNRLMSCCHLPSDWDLGSKP